MLTSTLEVAFPVQNCGLIHGGLILAASYLDTKDKTTIEKTKRERDRIYREYGRVYAELARLLESDLAAPDDPLREELKAMLAWFASRFAQHFARYPWDLRLGVANDLCGIVEEQNLEETLARTILFHEIRSLREGDPNGESFRILKKIYRTFDAHEALARLEAVLDPSGRHPLAFFKSRNREVDESPAASGFPSAGKIVRRELPPSKVKVCTMPSAILQAS